MIKHVYDVTSVVNGPLVWLNDKGLQVWEVAQFLIFKEAWEKAQSSIVTASAPSPKAKTIVEVLDVFEVVSIHFETLSQMLQLGEPPCHQGIVELSTFDIALPAGKEDLMSAPVSVPLCYLIFG